MFCGLFYQLTNTKDHIHTDSSSPKATLSIRANLLSSCETKILLSKGRRGFNVSPLADSSFVSRFTDHVVHLVDSRWCAAVDGLAQWTVTKESLSEVKCLDGVVGNTQAGLLQLRAF